jgi:hypothetical protein
MGRRGPWCLGEACLCVVRAGEWLEEDDTGDVVTGGGEKMVSGRLRGSDGFLGGVVGLGEEGPPTRRLDASTLAVTRRRQGARVSGTMHAARRPNGEGEEKKGKWALLRFCSR